MEIQFIFETTNKILTIRFAVGTLDSWQYNKLKKIHWFVIQAFLAFAIVVETFKESKHVSMQKWFMLQKRLFFILPVTAKSCILVSQKLKSEYKTK